LKEFGFAELETAHRNLIFLTYGHVPRIRGTRARESFIGLGPSIIKSIQESPDPDRTLASLECLVAAYGAGDMIFRMLSIHEGARDLLLSLCAGSQFLISLMVRNPGLLDWVVSPDVLYEDRSIQEMKDEFETVVDRVDSAERITTSMNAFKNRELLRIGTRDVTGRAGTFDTFDALTKLAETVLDVVVRTVYTNLSSKNGVPRNEDGGEVRFAVLGLGKLGRRELNCGSHLDLVLVYESDGQTDEVASADNSEFFEEFVQALLTTLTGSTPYGVLYPIDIRLKPQGTGSAISYLAYDQYLTDQGTTEERLGFSNARFVAGDEAFGQVLLDRLGDFVLGEGLNRQEAEELVACRVKISEEGAKRSEEGMSIKTAPGGLVDFEFITGVLQIRGGILGQSNTLQAIETLQAARRLDADDGRALLKAFSFMRTIEKVLRRQDESARTRLPVTDRALTAVARAMGFGSSVSFVGAIENEMAETRKRFDKYLSLTSG
jgi:glutamate-ammonia-ligase adenylyltransferase